MCDVWPMDAMQLLFFEDFEAGQVLPPGELTVSEADLDWFSAAFAAPWLDAAPWSQPPRAPARLHEWHVAALGMRLICEAFIGRTASLGAPGVEAVEWPEPVRVGDRVRLTTHVSSTRASRSRPTMGLVGFTFALTNQRDACVMRQSNVILVQRRERGTP